jgi:hypothetical protein
MGTKDPLLCQEPSPPLTPSQSPMNSVIALLTVKKNILRHLTQDAFSLWSYTALRGHNQVLIVMESWNHINYTWLDVSGYQTLKQSGFILE